MDEQNKNTETGAQVDENTTENGKKTEQTVEQRLQELTEQNQALMTEIAKYKKASDKNASEAADWKKKYNATLSAQEQASVEKAEKEAEYAEYVKGLEREVAVNRYFKQYTIQGYSAEKAQKAAEAFYDGDTDALFKISSEAQEEIIKAKEAEWLKSRPDIHAGTGSTQITQEQFNKMNITERTELFRKSPETYNRLMGR